MSVISVVLDTYSAWRNKTQHIECHFELSSSLPGQYTEVSLPMAAGVTAGDALKWKWEERREIWTSLLPSWSLRSGVKLWRTSISFPPKEICNSRGFTHLDKVSDSSKPFLEPEIQGICEDIPEVKRLQIVIFYHDVFFLISLHRGCLYTYVNLLPPETCFLFCSFRIFPQQPVNMCHDTDDWMIKSTQYLHL